MSKYTPITYPAWTWGQDIGYRNTFDNTYMIVNSTSSTAPAFTLTLTLTYSHLEGAVYFNPSSNYSSTTPGPTFSFYIDNTMIAQMPYDTVNLTYDIFNTFPYGTVNVQFNNLITGAPEYFSFAVDPIPMGTHTISFISGASTVAALPGTPAFGMGLGNVVWIAPNSTYYVALPAGNLTVIKLNYEVFYPNATLPGGLFQVGVINEILPEAPITNAIATTNSTLFLLSQWGADNTHMVSLSKGGIPKWNQVFAILTNIDFGIDFTPLLATEVPFGTTSTALSGGPVM